MKTYEELSKFNAKNPVVTIGTFDGVHLGHRIVIDRLKAYAKKYGGETVIFTFYPHPRLVTKPDETNLRLLTTLEEKKQLFASLGIDHLIVYPFTKEFSELTYTEFVKTILVDKIKTHCLVVGYDHKFGKDRQGGFEYLKECALKYNFEIEKLEPLLLNDIHISSTKIREALQKGDVKTANKYLGYEFTLHGTVVEGKRLGRQIGFPTANIESSDIHKLIPGYGVYAVKIFSEGIEHTGMLNIGTRPTFNQNADNRSIEVNIFDFEKDIYKKEVTLTFVDKIREEKKFPGVEALVEQLKKDKISALKILSANPNF
ncbi:bifunctional riboflavin kinase/FAD synthetase [Maribellus maritimus]|uniref:bifunctional riboflavin kinase/FAD synthetase n=1 Tax=Maribellus maritimus TaxID=2870838 RepID=UPI001EEB2AC0|nr:bifunctional riboflavin kinase/FAD synthetase [Maribellus maritimus]MCG6187494.1 bifunctional riboflavin kinase/FAD synthetase [Maribellus maritimus]